MSMWNAEEFGRYLVAADRVREISGLVAGETVVMLFDKGVQDALVSALWGIVKHAGAVPYLCGLDEHTGWEFPSIYEEAVGRADVVFASWPARATSVAERLRRERGQRWVSFSGCRTMDILLGPSVAFPIELSSMLVQQTWRRVPKGGPVQVRITDPKGTDVSFVLSEEHVTRLGTIPAWQGDLVAKGPGSVSDVPLSHGPHLIPPQTEWFTPTGEGSVLPDAICGFDGAYTGGIGDASFTEPVRIDMAESQVTRVSGGHEARHIERVLGGLGMSFDEVGLGFNPKFPTAGGTFVGLSGSNHSGAVHLGFGPVGRARREDAEGFDHLDVNLFQATVTCNEVVLVERGRLLALDDEEVRKAAERFGHPDSVLMESE